jgi:hypothetical protein
MKLRVGLICLFTFMLSGCSWSIRKSGVEIISNPPAKVYINGKVSGTTTYKNNSLTAGDTEIKLVVDEMMWSKIVHLQGGANTVINREFSKNTESGGYVLYFESTGDKKKAGVMISSTPDRATVSIDDEIKGYSPMRIENVGEGDKRLVISYPGRKSISSFVKFTNGYQLVVEADLPTEEIVIAPDVHIETPVSNVTMIKIKPTETGWLRVRGTPDTNGVEVKKVKPGEKYPLLEEKADWYKIDFGDKSSGWVSIKYAEKV